MSSSPQDFNPQVIDEFRANQGKVGGMFEGAPLLLLHHRGAKSGQERIAPLVYLADGDRYVTFASKGGAPTNPAWYHNLLAHPDVTLEVGSETLSAHADEVTGDERERLFAEQAGRMENFAEYARNTTRVIPVVVLTRA